MNAIPDNFDFKNGMPSKFLSFGFSKSQIAVIPPWRRVNIKFEDKAAQSANATQAIATQENATGAG